MEPEETEYQRRREASLAIMLALFLLGGFLLFLAVITGGFFLWVYLIVALIGLVGFFHYLLWGRSMMASTEGEREEEEARAGEEYEWTENDPRHPRHD